ncbi:MAG TPA: PAS domain-containing sensor histidine kinase [Anaerolineaceae bacterium]|nr:PAS domain-containing sensor histidine kinase [Anaerolineaceae bacterium]
MKNRLPLFFLAGFVVYALWLVLFPIQEETRQVTGSLGLLAGGILLAAVTGWGMRRLQAQPALPARIRLAWQGLFGVSLVWLAVDVLRLAQFASPSTPLLQMLSEGLFVLGMAGLCVAVLLVPRPRRAPFSGSRVLPLPILMDILLTTVGLAALFWLVLLSPFLDSLTTNPDATGLAALYPLVDAFTFFLMINLFLLTEQENGQRPAAGLLSSANANPAPVSAASEPPTVRVLPGTPPALGWITFAVLAYTFADLGYAYLLPAGGYQPGGVLDLVWLLGDFLMALATFYQLRALQPVAVSSQPADQKAGKKGNFTLAFLPARFQSFLPIVVILAVVWYTVLDNQFFGSTGQNASRSPSFTLWLTLLLGIGVIVRQGMQLGEMELSRYANLVNSIAEPAFVCDRFGRLQLVNPAVLAIAGYENTRELLHRPLEILIAPQEDVRVMREAGQKGGWSGETYLRRWDGELLPVSLALRPLAGRALAGTAHDLSEQKRQQAALQAANEQIEADRSALEQLNAELERRVEEKTASLSEAYQQLEEQNRALQQLDQLKSDFVSLVSHELRAPLTNIRGGIELLGGQRGLKSGPPRETLDLVQAEITRLSRFVETILDISALDAGRMPLYPSPMALRTVIDTLKQQTHHLPGAKRIQWRIPNDLPSLLADDQALTSILFHLLDNAMKYAPDGMIEVEAGYSSQQAGGVLSSGSIWVRVRDEGPGIPTRQLAMLFTRFYRANPRDSQEIYGHGLGLYIVKRLLEAMHGEIEVCNREEGGACFTIYIPVFEN